MTKNKKKRSVRAVLGSNRVLMVIAVVLAFLTWVVVAGFINPGDSKPIRNVAIDYERDEASYRNHDLMIITPSVDLYADVQVTGDGAILGSIDKDSVSVYADYSLITEPGTYEVPLRTSKIDAGSWSIMEWSTKTDGHSLDNPYHMVVLTFEKMETKTLPITVRADGVTAAQGFFTDSPVADPESITIRGPRSKVELVSRAVAEVVMEEEIAERKKYLGVTIELLDENGEEIDAEAAGITISPDTVEVDISVLVMREMLLHAEFTGLPAYFDTEWFYERISLSVDTIQVIGPASSFETYSNTLTVATFDASQLGLNWESDLISIQMPEGSGLRNNDEQRTVTVLFDTTGLVEKTFEVPVSAADVVNGPANATVEPLQSTVTVRLLGPQEQIDTLLPENIAIEIDAFGITSNNIGQQSIPARIKAPAADQCIPLGGYSIVCDVEPGS